MVVARSVDGLAVHEHAAHALRYVRESLGRAASPRNSPHCAVVGAAREQVEPACVRSEQALDVVELCELASARVWRVQNQHFLLASGECDLAVVEQQVADVALLPELGSRIA